MEDWKSRINETESHVQRERRLCILGSDGLVWHRALKSDASLFPPCVFLFVLIAVF